MADVKRAVRKQDGVRFPEAFPPEMLARVAGYGQLGGLRYGAQTRANAIHRGEYANRVEVERNEYDVTLNFYRDSKTIGTLVKTITVPLALLDSLAVD